MRFSPLIAAGLSLTGLPALAGDDVVRTEPRSVADQHAAVLRGPNPPRSRRSLFFMSWAEKTAIRLAARLEAGLDQGFRRRSSRGARPAG